jgi:hypothetical protein
VVVLEPVDNPDDDPEDDGDYVVLETNNLDRQM